MLRTRLEEHVYTLPGDMVTPVAMYRRLRDCYPGSCLLESVDFQPGENCSTYICVHPIIEYRAEPGTVHMQYPGVPGRESVSAAFSEKKELLEQFIASVEVARNPAVESRSIANGFFGYLAYDSIQVFEDIEFASELEAGRAVPEILYQVFEFVIAVNHYRNEMYLIQNRIRGENTLAADQRARELMHVVFHQPVRTFSFRCTGEEYSNFSDAEHKQVIEKCKEHIFRGDVFQIVPSRRFSQPYRGDDFMVYRSLRSINPSPYLFYFDYGSFRIMGSSPEAELIVKDGRATLCPIAGTYPRFSDPEEEARRIEQLKNDPKENAEHVMLVDLARNDLSKHCDEVRVDTYREVHRFSHVIHLVSTVSGRMGQGTSTISLLGDTFPAGTLSGAPKYKAMELIDRYERGARGIYGGAIGFIDFNGDTNHAIMIRTFLSKDGELHRQAGGGVVADSVLQEEVTEVRNKLAALAAAIRMAEEMCDETVSPR